MDANVGKVSWSCTVYNIKILRGGGGGERRTDSYGPNK